LTMNKKSVFGILLVIAFAVTCNAAAAQVLTWEDCVREALQNNTDLITAREDIKQADAGRVIAASGWYPQVDLSGSLDQDADYSLGLSASQLLYDGFNSEYSIEKARIDIEVADQNYQQSSISVRQKLRNAFIDVLKKQEQVRLTKTIDERRKQSLDLVRLRYEAGREHLGSLLTSEAKYAQSELDARQAEQGLELSRRQLSDMLGRAVYTPLVVTGSILIERPAGGAGDVTALAFENPALKVKQLQLESSELGLKSAEDERYPQLSASLEASYSGTNTSEAAGDLGARAGFSLTLLDGGKNEAGIARAKSSLFEANIAHSKAVTDTLYDLENAKNNLINAIDQAKIQYQYLQATRERLRISEVQYSTGLITYDSWTNIEDDLVQREKSYLDALARAAIAEAGYLYVLGEGLTE
ncbi:TolC family protein, partial [Candidatus Margulisiibacteriota bacterium]